MHNKNSNQGASWVYPKPKQDNPIQANPKAVESFSAETRPTYQNEKNVRQDIGYGSPTLYVGERPKVPVAEEVFKGLKTFSARESPLKEWWLNNQHQTNSAAVKE